MKTTTILGVLFTSMALSSAAFAGARPYGMAGCGLGSMVMGSGGSQVTAATTNMTAYNQLFGITSGTLNCVPDNAAQASINELPNFVHNNAVALADDIARGHGETLISLSALMACENPKAVAPLLQSHFTEIFPSEKVDPWAVSNAIIDAVEQDQAVFNSCQNLL